MENYSHTYTMSPFGAFRAAMPPCGLTWQILRYLLIGMSLGYAIQISPFAAFLLVFIAIHAISRKEALYIGLLVLMMTMTISNTLFFPRTVWFFTAVRISFGLLALSVLPFFFSHAKPTPFRKLDLLFIYLLAVTFSSLLGWNPLISVLKLFLFTVFIIALFGVGAYLAQSQVSANSLRAVSFATILYVVFGSLALIPFPAIGNSMILGRSIGGDIGTLMQQEVQLFNGVTWHAQTLGPLLAILNAFVLTELLRKPRQYRKFYLLTLAAIPILIFHTGSRTGFISYIISIVAPLFWQGLIRYKGRLENRQRTVVMLALLLLGPVYFFALGGSTQIQNFLRKGGSKNVSVTERLKQSRMGLAENALRNFRQRPLFGNGFQVSEEMQFYKNENLAKLLSAPIEKGVLPTMVLEESGILGFSIFLLFMVAVLRTGLQYGCLRFLTTFTTFIATNSGEATFFSISALGGVFWALCVFALVIDWKEYQQTQPLAQAPNKAYA